MITFSFVAITSKRGFGDVNLWKKATLAVSMTFEWALVRRIEVSDAVEFV